jgi:hypothetical protein
MIMNICLLLTASISPLNVAYLERTNPNARKQDYYEALRFYINNTSHKIVFVENTNSDIQALKAIDNHGRVEFLQFDARNESSKYGKGYGEMLILKYCMDNSCLIKNTDWIFKITGRLVLKNVVKIIDSNLSRKEVDIFADLKGNLFYSDSRCFMFKKDFFSYLYTNISLINDHIRRDFEQILGKSILEYVVNGNKWQPLSHYPIFKGVSATDNRQYNDSLINFIVNELKRKCLLRLFNYY